MHFFSLCPIDVLSGTRKKPPDKKPLTLNLPVSFTIKQDTRVKYHLRTAKFCIHVKNSYANIHASLCEIWSKN